MDSRKSFRFRVARFINRLLFLRAFSRSIDLQYAITRRILPLPKGTAIVPTIHNIILKLDIHADVGEQLQGSIDRNLYYLGTYELGTLEIIRKYLKSDGVFIDVGSHNGSVALYASKIAEHGKVVAFEPVVALQEYIQQNIALNNVNNVFLAKVALGSKQRVATININYNNRGSSSLEKNSHETYAGRERVRVETLDSQLGSMGIAQVDMIKIDVEGVELDVLKGAKDTIVRYHPILIIEHDPKNKDTRGPYDYIRSIELYDVYIPKNGRHMRGPLVKVNHYSDIPKNYVTNYLCLPK